MKWSGTGEARKASDTLLRPLEGEANGALNAKHYRRAQHAVPLQTSGAEAPVDVGCGIWRD